MMRRTALRRLAEVEDVADAVEYLLGDGAQHRRHGNDRRRRRHRLATAGECRLAKLAPRRRLSLMLRQ